MRMMANDLQILSTTDKRLILWNVWYVLLLFNINRVVHRVSWKWNYNSTDWSFKSSFKASRINNALFYNVLYTV